MNLLLENGDHIDVLDTITKVNFDQKAYELHKAYKDVIHKVRRTMNSYYAHADMSFNKGIRSKPFTTGYLCYVQILCPKHKFAPRWHGPVRIFKVLNEHVYVVKIGDIEKVVNISKLKKYQALTNSHLPLIPKRRNLALTETEETSRARLPLRMEHSYR